MHSNIITQSMLNVICFLAAGSLLGTAALFPETTLSMVLTWAALIGLSFCVRLILSQNSSATLGGWFHRLIQSSTGLFFLAGVMFHAIAFHWLPSTLQLFGGFPFAIALLLFVCFVVGSSLQFALVGWLYARFSHTVLAKLCLALPAAWFLAEFFVPRLFPWAVAHLQIRWSSFAILAQIVGVTPLGFLLVWFAALASKSALALRKSRRISLQYAVPLFAMVTLICAYGDTLLRRTTEVMEMSQSLTVGIVQGNLEAKEKGDIQLLEANIDRYRMLSEQAEKGGAEILFWPETVMTKWAPEEVANVAGTTLDPYPLRTVPLVYGGLAFRRDKDSNGRAIDPKKIQMFNGGFAVDLGGTILGRYYKRILMPFGEYLPLAEYFPWIKEISPHSGDFTVGDLLEPITVPLPNRTVLPAKLGMLICYEDLIPSLTSDAVRRGANLLVNLTNDAWYGRTAAAHQHHLLALWRAIESGRYLLRVTNTGYTGVVNPLGVTEQSLPEFSEGVIIAPIKLIESVTIYTLLGDRVAWALTALFSCLLLVTMFGRRPVEKGAKP